MQSAQTATLVARIPIVLFFMAGPHSTFKSRWCAGVRDNRTDLAPSNI
jgi:hypothetical protein